MKCMNWNGNKQTTNSTKRYYMEETGHDAGARTSSILPGSPADMLLNAFRGQIVAEGDWIAPEVTGLHELFKTIHAV